jgi:Domain of unknown function (DUF4149)
MIALFLASSILSVLLFVSIVVLPVAFSALTKINAGKFFRKFFPKFHITLFLASQVTGVLAISPYLKPISFIAGILIAAHYLWLTPAINSASDQKEDEKFKKLHAVSVMVHLLIILLFAVALIFDTCYFM